MGDRRPERVDHRICLAGKPSWYLVATEDRMIPPPAQRAMSERAGSTVTVVAGSHAIYVTQPAAVAAIIGQAASATAAAPQQV